MKKLLIGFCGLLYTCCSLPTTKNMDFEHLFKNKKVLVTGGTGYLGRTLTQEILRYDPAFIKVLSRDEVKLFHTYEVLKNNPKIIRVLGDVRDYPSLLRHTKGIDLIIHAAALKRMDALESNTQESVKTNVLGSVNVFNAALVNEVDRVVFISTDKACSPVNIYGGCKFVSEKIFTNYDYASLKTIFTVVRFGNILESTGSVIPIFLRKIKNGEQITLTDPRMTRFIITKDDAVAYIFRAMQMSAGGEIFITKLPAMGIVDLIDILTKKYDYPHEIKNIGIRPGEKIHEVLINKEEIRRTYFYNDMCVITPTLPTWRENLEVQDKLPVYIKQGQPLEMTQEIFSKKGYSSKGAVISYEALRNLVDVLIKRNGW